MFNLIMVRLWGIGVCDNIVIEDLCGDDTSNVISYSWLICLFYGFVWEPQAITSESLASQHQNTKFLIPTILKY